MDRVGSYEYHTEAYSLDFQGRLTIPALAGYLLHAATRHAAERGFGYDDMLKHQILWVLSRLKIEIIDHTRLSEPLRIYTWVEAVERIFTYRCFEIESLDGQTLGYARTIWAGINQETRRPASLENTGLPGLIVRRLCPVAFDKFECQPDGAEVSEYRIKYSDLDINGHFSSIKYLESILDMFDLEMYRKYFISRFDIIYQAEGFYGMLLSIYKKQTGGEEYLSAIYHGEKSLCRAKVSFNPTV